MFLLGRRILLFAKIDHGPLQLLLVLDLVLNLLRVVEMHILGALLHLLFHKGLGSG